jgi:hypothetical protein
VSDYCPAHDYGDPGFPPDECPACKALNAPDMSAELDALRAQLREVEERASPLLVEMDKGWCSTKRELAEMRVRAESAEAALKEAEWRAAEWERASGLNATEMSRYQRQAIAAETLAERYRRALVKAEAFLDENDYRLPMSGREAAALATIRIALQQGKGEGE